MNVAKCPWHLKERSYTPAVNAVYFKRINVTLSVETHTAYPSMIRATSDARDGTHDAEGLWSFD